MAKPLVEPPTDTAEEREPLRAGATLGIYWRTIRQYPRDMAWCTLYPIGMVLLGVGVPYYIGRLLANISNPAVNLRQYLLMLAIVSLVGIVCHRLGFAGIWRMQANVLSDLQRQSLDILLRRSAGFHSNNISGKLVSDALDYQQAYARFTAAAYIGALPFALILIIGLSVVMWHSWMMGASLAIIMTITITWAILESRTRAALRNRRLVATKRVTGHFSDTIINAQTVKAFAGETNEDKRHLHLNHILRDLRVKDWLRANRSSNNRMGTLLVFQIGFMAGVVYLVQRDPDLLGIGIFAFTYTFMLIQRLFEVNVLTRELEESLLLASPMTNIYLQDIEVKDAPGAPALRATAGEIKLEDVHFRYDNDQPAGEAVFEGLNIHIRPGEKIGLAGPSGGGKSTLTRLLLRFEDVTSGRILIDGQDISKVTQTSLRQQIAYVAQEPLLFHRTVRENIAYGRADASDEAVIAAARKAHAHDFIEKLPQGYDTIVGERGVKLSGGQRQRVAIARAILKDTPILILDEATSALDSESESLVQEALWQLMKGRTTLVIAHRLSTIQKMDRIIVLENGRITEEGSHAALIRRKGMYARLWSHQSGGFLQDEEEDTAA